MRGGLSKLALICWSLYWVLVVLGAGRAQAAAVVAKAPPCHVLSQGLPGGVLVPGNCTWQLGSQTPPAASKYSIIGTRQPQTQLSITPATPCITNGAAPAPSKPGAAAGVQLVLERLVLIGFQITAPGVGPVLWPQGLVAGSGEQLNMTDVRVVIRNQEVFNKYLNYFSRDSNTVLFTDNTNYVHIQQWSDSHTHLSSVSLLLDSSPAGAASSPIIRNCLLLATNASLVPTLQPHAAMATPLPLLVYLTSNVTLGTHPRLPDAGITIRRPVVFVGLRSEVTAIDFEMVVNQLNASSSEYSNVTFAGVVLENLAPGDSATSTTAAPFSVAITNNVWAVYYNRSVPNKVRLALNNVTLVVSQEAEMTYVMYMFTVFSSQLQYLKQQTSFYTDVLHVSVLQFFPGPGTHAITVTHLISWYHWWGDVVLTTIQPVGQSLPLPARPLVLTSSTRASPLVQAVRTPEELKSFAEAAVVGDREHILLILSNVSLSPASSSSSSSGSINQLVSSTRQLANKSAGSQPDPIRISSPMAWVGYMGQADEAVPAGRTGPQQQQKSANKHEHLFLGFGYRAGAVDITEAAQKEALRMRQLVLWQLPQGRNAAAAPLTGKAVPAELFTLLLWAFDRPPSSRPLHLDGISLQLPAPEMDYLAAYARQTNDFVVEVAGTTTRMDGITFEDAYFEGSALRVAAITAPGFTGTNITLLPDPDAAAAMPGGYYWPDPSQWQVPSGGRSPQPPWVAAVVAVCITLAVALMALAGYLCWQRKRLCLQAAEVRQQQPDLEASHGSNSKAVSRCSSYGVGPGCNQQHRQHGSDKEKCSNSVRSIGSQSIPDSAADIPAEDMAAASKHSSPHSQQRKPAAFRNAALPTQQGAAAAAAAAGQPQDASSGQGNALPSGCIDVAAQRDVPMVGQMSDSSTSLLNNVAAGMQRWRAAVSSTTMLLMERRMDAAAAVGQGSHNSSGSQGPARSPSGITQGAAEGIPEHLSREHAVQQDEQPPNSTRQGSLQNSGSSSSGQLVLKELLGQGSFGSVFLATWRGRQVAVKVIQLPASALLKPMQQQKNSSPHMALMEAVLSSTMSHPNVVQVYTYMLSPLTSPSTTQAADAGGQVVQAEQRECGSSSGQDTIAGWSVKLVMEYCDEGSLREALDNGLLAKPGGFLAPSAVLNLAHDVAAAMLHLHSEGIVHGDLKAGNVMLTSGGGSNTSVLSTARVWAGAAGDRPLTAKVADFGLALPLGPADTHATLLARGTPTHMSPELFMAGHVSKASDVYAYGILLYEIMTGRRAYAGVPIPLLPHEVARQGLRPEWPQGMPPGCRDLKKLAEACWVQKPQDRPTFADILDTLDVWAAGGHGWPAVLPQYVSRQPHEQQLQQQQQPPSQPPPPQQPPQPPPSPQEQQLQQNGQLRSQQQQQQQQPAPAAGMAAGGAGCNMRMSWSEVKLDGGS